MNTPQHSEGTRSGFPFSSSTTTSSPSPQDQATRSARILIVDDDTVVGFMLAKVLVCSGYRVDMAADGEAAWRVLCANTYDLLITDNNMPKLTGLELVERVRSADCLLPIIMVTGGVDTEVLNGDPLRQVDAILLKPFTTEQLLKVVGKVLHMVASLGNQAGAGFLVAAKS